jgi:hypothetical protein
MNTRNLKNVVFGFALGSFGLVAVAVTIPNTFTSGTVISSGAVNANFAAVKSAVDTLEATEVGITQGRSGSIQIADSEFMIDIVTTTITIPKAGYINVSAIGQANVFTSASGFCGTNYQIDELNGGTIDPSYVLTAGSGLSGVSLASIPAYANRVYSKPAGTYTFRLEARRDRSVGITQSCGGNSFNNSSITATFIPVNYGTVAAAQATSAR